MFCLNCFYAFRLSLLSQREDEHFNDIGKTVYIGVIMNILCWASFPRRNILEVKNERALIEVYKQYFSLSH